MPPVEKGAPHRRPSPPALLPAIEPPPAQPYPAAAPSPSPLAWQEGVQYPMSADEVWLHKLIIEVDRARKHESRHVTTARNHLRRHEQAVAAHDAFLRDAHPPPVGPEEFEEASEGEGEEADEDEELVEDELDGMPWEDAAAEDG